jgi:type V secretory pathway adhesin AidA
MRIDNPQLTTTDQAQLTFSGINDGQYLKRSGTLVVGDSTGASQSFAIAMSIGLGG